MLVVMFIVGYRYFFLPTPIVSCANATFSKLFTTFSCIGIAIQGVFFTEYNVEGYEGQDHVFTGVQKAARSFVDRNIYGIDTSSTGSGQQPQDPSRR